MLVIIYGLVLAVCTAFAYYTAGKLIKNIRLRIIVLISAGVITGMIYGLYLIPPKLIPFNETVRTVGFLTGMMIHPFFYSAGFFLTEWKFPQYRYSALVLVAAIMITVYFDLLFSAIAQVLAPFEIHKAGVLMIADMILIGAGDIIIAVLFYLAASIIAKNARREQ
ncbi:hypothetical protein F1737_09715 [Methanoplanus sp. FWC-SCC4]|uniref:Uncharacterized protein n=1 Tax=Methanochimaera problematica TaxID=2609417 RepID=A0AA97FF86_9EURY|nr:hypothetical protein [Methanoplanus sp. FWC-SCC4]WOF16943.1 hypothetical protein F1737_09715 [Methanoplanus sp. FWC-SCC4]